jgi:predicted O-methyltransferase YrrM
VTELVGAMVRATQPDHVVETGTYLGHTAEAIGRALAANGHGRLYTIEQDEALAGEARHRCLDLPVIVINGDTLSFCPPFPIDFAWFDSGDLIRGAEFRRFHRFMHERTVVGFHDAGPQHRVFDQVLALVDEGLLARPLLIHSPRGVCFANVLRCEPAS